MPRAGHDVAKVFKIRDLITGQTDLTTTWNALAFLYVLRDSLTFASKQGTTIASDIYLRQWQWPFLLAVVVFFILSHLLLVLCHLCLLHLGLHRLCFLVDLRFRFGSG